MSRIWKLDTSIVSATTEFRNFLSLRMGPSLPDIRLGRSHWGLRTTGRLLFRFLNDGEPDIQELCKGKIGLRTRLNLTPRRQKRMMRLKLTGLRGCLVSRRRAEGVRGRSVRGCCAESHLLTPSAKRVRALEPSSWNNFIFLQQKRRRSAHSLPLSLERRREPTDSERVDNSACVASGTGCSGVKSCQSQTSPNRQRTHQSQSPTPPSRSHGSSAEESADTQVSGTAGTACARKRTDVNDARSCPSTDHDPSRLPFSAVYSGIPVYEMVGF
jgi:hypothetical protein